MMKVFSNVGRFYNISSKEYSRFIKSFFDIAQGPSLLLLLLSFQVIFYLKLPHKIDFKTSKMFFDTVQRRLH